MGIIYLDSSVALYAVLDVPQRSALHSWMATSGALHVSSRLLRTEVVRVLRREDIPVSQAAPLLDRVGLLDVTREVHRVAEDIRPHVKTLDALHLATAVTLKETLDTPLTIATHDKTMTSVAHQLGLGTVDPVTPGNPPQG
ncbi:type II toxin-antitoxin system VapC family toxin [Actinomyces israelii]|uniref:type II toxin-antitoxin system VapC family toxin n=1 Tax=Actinomyces israelii TaxID=1659 RepID=UPI0005B8C4C9|nr:type II toxin-antitoxin system VapC family toxin [Actinomyces israelii]